MLKPSMQELMRRVGNRYLLVNLAAQRARDLADQAEADDDPLPDKAVKLALDEIAKGAIVYRPGPRTVTIIPQNNAVAAAAMIDMDDSIDLDGEDVMDSENEAQKDEEMHSLSEFDDEELDDGDVPVEDQ